MPTNRKALVAILLLLIGGGVKVARQRPKALNVVQFVSGIPSLTPEMRLTVARLETTKTAHAQSAKKSWGVDWGTTKVSVSVPVCIHYAIDLSGAAPVEFHHDPSRKLVTAVFRDPEVQSVEVFTKAENRVVEPGWGRLAVFSGQALVDSLDAGFYDSVKVDAASSQALAQVRDLARPGLAALVSSFLSRNSIDAAVVVRFRSDGSTIARR